MTTRAEELRDALVDKIIKGHVRQGLTMRADVERALRTVPRELFTPGVSLEEAYEDTAIVTKRREDGVGISSVSAPYLIAEMLGQASGRHVLEVGSGGYNAALLREIAGPDGSVTTVDIDPDVTDRARACLDAAGYTDVKVVCADAEFGIEPGRTYDMIIITVGAWDIPPAWISQLADGGTLVVPLRTLGMTRSWALQRSGNHLVSRSNLMCGFVPMQGAGASDSWNVALGDGVTLWLTEPQQDIDGGAVTGVFSQERHEARSGVTVPGGRLSANLDLWLATHLPDFGSMIVPQEAIDSGLVVPSWRWGTPAFVDGTTLAYRGKLRQVDEAGTEFEYVAYAHGPGAAGAAERMADQIRAWDEVDRPAPTLCVFPIDTPDADLPEGLVLNKRHSRVVFTWPLSK
ncbi:protein-L-isoaspartate(D-aspartate) O-methyltransferase [Protofrankia coriariae]|uniref:Protein-L-isoaspartate O-methyltransferase n=1 Tax=Protofrankia coriariae TaxID=1562887 RepID=A0ABR5F1K4_9ACTN|nr:protein-L-isoaspartate(D-aspartate) O-methyltransferase [Protofrankia coriariae]